MRRELEEDLAQKHPFMRRRASLKEQVKQGVIGDLYSAFGCECGDGWHGLLDSLCYEIERIYEEAGIPCRLHVTQVKQKFGSLRFYATLTGPKDLSDKVSEVIQEAVDASEHICEECGRPGKLRHDAWVRTQCDDCHAKDL